MRIVGHIKVTLNEIFASIEPKKVFIVYKMRL